MTLKTTKFPQFWLNAFNFDSQLLSNEGVNEESRSTNFFSIAKSCLMSREASSLENEFEKHFSGGIFNEWEISQRLVEEYKN